MEVEVISAESPGRTINVLLIKTDTMTPKQLISQEDILGSTIYSTILSDCRLISQYFDQSP